MRESWTTTRLCSQSWIGIASAATKARIPWRLAAQRRLELRFFNQSYDNLVIRSRAEEVSCALYTGLGMPSCRWSKLN